MKCLPTVRGATDEDGGEAENVEQRWMFDLITLAVIKRKDKSRVNILATIKSSNLKISLQVIKY